MFVAQIVICCDIEYNANFSVPDVINIKNISP